MLEKIHITDNQIFLEMINNKKLRKYTKFEDQRNIIKYEKITTDSTNEEVCHSMTWMFISPFMNMTLRRI